MAGGGQTLRELGEPGQQFVIRQGPSFYVVPNCQAKVATTVTM